MSNNPDHQTGLGPVDALFRGIVYLCRVITGVALVSLTVLLGYQVFGRYVLNDTPTWVDPLSLLLIMLIAFLGAGIGVYEHTHLSVVMMRQAVTARIRTAMVLLTDLMMAGFGGLMMWYGWQLTAFKWKNDIPLIGLPEGLRSLPLTICGGMILVFALGHLVRVLLGRDTRADSVE
ncbi:TRAP transporter small permease [Pseudooctadecabacter jejudonensis]|uniref:TRAP transporter small permease protein n=1 Tax=Pseudooctadecabacter jejudonensis TaxID=1391910 RepID=A0A1Y5TFZ4_9RHOB|nr:TRAP transporter small permease [Pseudooctadecabacter jejudonensis]SLN63200.1 2,3-diketo-L-gulonate TRAP transporter small permease protein YiaM [Pseudooctadecabacter jejudonensis]